MQVPKEMTLCVFGILIGILLRVSTSLHPYSGQGKPKMFGDYEAQRHWMEVTVNLPVGEWYHNTSNNDLQYWGLDYPPLTAYHSYVCGLLARFIDGDYVELHKSRGYESESHKLFMRYTVLMADVFVYIPSVVFYFYATRNLYVDSDHVKLRRNRSKIKKHEAEVATSLSVALALFYPGLILVDHGHFQYNCVSLGFFVFAVSFVCLKRYILASVFFCLALNYKQMELFHAFPFFLYLLSMCIPKPGSSIFSSCVSLVKISATVAVTFVIIWFPFLFNAKDVLQVMHRLFPIARGVFEDKVANVWCALNVFYKLKTAYCDSEMLRMCTATTLVSILPSSIDLFVRPNVIKFIPSLINSSLAFFLFGFQVHEKSVLLVAVPVALYLPNSPIACFWFLIVSTFSMLPLLSSEGLVIAFVALTVFYAVAFKNVYEQRGRQESILSLLHRELVNVFVATHRSKKGFHVHLVELMTNWKFLKRALSCVSFFVSLAGCVGLTIAIVIFDPPSRYPDLYPLLISVYSCVHFVGFFVYFNVVQLKLPQGFDEVKFVKLKMT